MKKSSRILPLNKEDIRAPWERTVLSEMGSLSARLETLLEDASTPPRLGFCATFPGAGTTTMATNFAIYRTHQGDRVGLLEANLRRPSLASLFALQRAAGLWELMNGTIRREQLLEGEVGANLILVPAGQVPAEFRHPSIGDHVRAITDALAALADIVVVDAPALNTSPETPVILASVDAVVLVVKSGHSRRQDVLRSIKLFAEMQVAVAGILLNGVQYDTPSALDRLL